MLSWLVYTVHYAETMAVPSLGSLCCIFSRRQTRNSALAPKKRFLAISAILPFCQQSEADRMGLKWEQILANLPVKEADKEEEMKRK